MLKICFLGRPCYDKYATKLFIKLQEQHSKEIKGYFITSNEKETKYVSSVVEGRNAEVWEVSSYFKKHWEEFTYEKFVEFEKKYDCEPLWKYIYTDRFLINMDYEYCVKITTGYFFFYEDLFGNDNIDFYYDETIATLQSYLAVIVGKKYGVQYISQMTARGGLDATYHYFLSDPYQMNMLFDDTYKNKTYSNEEVEFATKFLTEFENKDIKPANMVFTGQKPRFKASFLLLPLKYIIKSWGKVNRDKYFYMYYKQASHAMDPMIFYFRYKKSKKYYKKPDLKKKYVYYPLHYQPEASTIVCAQKYEKQLFFIDSLAKSIPADTVLYVKEHYAILGHRDLSFYRELKKYPNVVLIDPWENSRTLMKNAVVVATLTGTAGWEAMLLRKPVILGGQIFFSNAPGVIKVEEIYDNYVNIINNWKQPTREEIIHYLCELFSTFREGNVYVSRQPALEDSNISKIAKALFEQMRTMKKL